MTMSRINAERHARGGLGVFLLCAVVAGAEGSRAIAANDSASTRAAGVAVPIFVSEPSGIARDNWPVTSGVPFARGRLHEIDRLWLVRVGENRPLPLQMRITCRWPDGSVKWLLMDTRVSLAPGTTQRLLLHGNAGRDATPPLPPVTHEARAGGVRISTGPLQADLAAPANLPGPVWLDFDGDGACGESERLADRPWSLVLETVEGRTYRSDALAANLAVEEAGPLRTAVRIRGRLADDRRTPAFSYVVRLHFYAGRPLVRAFVTLIVDVADRTMVNIRSFRLVVPTSERGSHIAVFGGDTAPVAATQHDDRAHKGRRLLQVDDQEYRIDGRPSGRRAAGWICATGSRAQVAAGVRHFWQQWPKALAASADALHVELIPPSHEGSYGEYSPKDQSKWTYALRDGGTLLKQGVAKTHEVWLWYGRPGADGGAPAVLFRQAFEPLLATCEPGYICATQALGDFPPADPSHPDRFLGYDACVANAFRMHRESREQAREYGVLNFGDWWGERGYNWGNLEYDLQRGLSAQYARTGRREYYLRAEEAARHHIDVDVVHAVNGSLKNPSGRPPAVGDVWVHATGHTGGYFPPGAFGLELPYTMGYSRNLGHVWDRGDLDYYFLSGDERAREVALAVAERLRADAVPYFRIGTHNRDIGWPMLALLAAWRATGETKYLDGARRGWEVFRAGEDPNGGWVITLARDHCNHKDTRCKGNVAFMTGIVLSALCDYHRETGDADVARCIVRAADFIIRETWVAEKKAFRYTSCPLTVTSPSGAYMLSEGIAYAWKLSGEPRFLRTLHESMGRIRESTAAARFLVFTPEALSALGRTGSP